MSYFYCSPVSNIPPEPLPHWSQPLQPQPEPRIFASRMVRTDSNSSTMSTSSASSSISIPSSYHRPSRPDSTSASFSSPWSSPTSTFMSSGSQGYGHARQASNQTSYLPTPYRSALQHSCSPPAWAATKDAPSSYFTDSELLSPSLDASFFDPPRRQEMTTEEQVAAVRAQVERERDELPPDNLWRHQRRAPPADRKTRVLRFAGEPCRPSAAREGHGMTKTGRSSRKAAALGPVGGHKP